MLFVLTGPESAGKSALTMALAGHFSAPYIDEVARTYISPGHAYEPSELLNIAEQQQSAEATSSGALAFADTDLQVLYIWWQERFGPVPRKLADAFAQQGPRHYLLCMPDLAWVPDPLRENPHDRDRLLQLYEADLRSRGLAFSRIQGVGEARVSDAIKAVNRVRESRLEPGFF